MPPLICPCIHFISQQTRLHLSPHEIIMLVVKSALSYCAKSEGGLTYVVPLAQLMLEREKRKAAERKLDRYGLARPKLPRPPAFPEASPAPPSQPTFVCKPSIADASAFVDAPTLFVCPSKPFRPASTPNPYLDIDLLSRKLQRTHTLSPSRLSQQT